MLWIECRSALNCRERPLTIYKDDQTQVSFRCLFQLSRDLMKWQWLGLLFALLCTACSKAERTDSGDGQLYINALTDAVLKADRIVVTEHSNIYDVLGSSTQQPSEKDYRPVIYSTHELSLTERTDFLDFIKKLKPDTQDAFAACIFEPHHTVTFFQQGRRASTMRICFTCGQVEWDGSNKTPPWSLIPMLKNMIGKIGMKDERDWNALATAAGNQGVVGISPGSYTR